MNKSLVFKIVLPILLIIFALFVVPNPVKSKFNKTSSKSSLKTAGKENFAYDTKDNANLMTKIV